MRSIAPRGVKTVIACATPTRSYDQCIGFLGFRGTLVCLGVPENDRTPIKGAEAFTLLNNELTIMCKMASHPCVFEKRLTISSFEGGESVGGEGVSATRG